jgi:DNA-binding response OmpR family regulator
MRLLLIEDEIDLAYQIMRFLTKRQHHVTVCNNLNDSLLALSNQVYDAVLLDRLLPEGDALKDLARIKGHHEGFMLVMSALGEVQDRVAAFNRDVNYYLSKPIDFDELLAILEQFERKITQTASSNPSVRAENASSSWYIKRKRLYSPDQLVIQLTVREAMMVELMIAEFGQLVTRSALIMAMNQDPINYDSKALDSAVYRIRHKIEQATGKSVPFETVHGVGYVWHD